mgnify:FL=1
MVEPIRRNLEYAAIGRKCLMVDQVPQGAYPRYERDVAATASVLPRRGGAPVQHIEGEEVLVPTFVIVSHPSISFTEVRARRFYVIDRAQIKSKEAIQKEEDSNILATAIAAADNRGDQIVTNVGTLSVNSLLTAYRYVDQHDLVASKVIMNAKQFSSIRGLGKTFYDEATQREVISTGLFGHLWTADIHVTSRMAPDVVLVLASNDTVGVFPIRQDITVIPADDPANLRIGWVVFEEVGICILNDYSISKIEVTSAT